MLRLVGHPVAVNPDSELGRVARAEGWEVLRFERLGRRLRVAGAAGVAAALGGLGSVVLAAARPRRAGWQRRAPAPPMSLHELTAEQREIRDLARALRRRADRAARGGTGTASTPSRARCSPSWARSG